jgi:hypothetical protein
MTKYLTVEFSDAIYRIDLGRIKVLYVDIEKRLKNRTVKAEELELHFQFEENVTSWVSAYCKWDMIKAYAEKVSDIPPDYDSEWAIAIKKVV